MQVLYIGDFLKKNGPSTVDLSIRNVFFEQKNSNVKFIQANQRLNLDIVKSLILADVIHVSGISFLGLLLVVLGRVLSKKTSLTMHGLLRLESQYRVVPKKRLYFEWLLIFFVDRIFPVSPLLAKEIGKNKMVVIPNGIANKEYSSIKKDKYLITLIGGGRREKRHLDVCQVINRINKKGDINLRVCLFGEKGVDSKELEKFDFIQDFGFCSKSKVESSLSQSYIFIQYSEFESFSLAIAEAINYNCKIIASDTIGINDFIVPSACYKVVSCPDQLEQAIVDMVNDKSEYNISDRLLTWEQVAQEYSNNWNSL